MSARPRAPWICAVTGLVLAACCTATSFAADWLDPAVPIRAVVLGRKAITMIDDANWSIRAAWPAPEGFAVLNWATADGRYVAAVYQEGIWAFKGPAKLFLIDVAEAHLSGPTTLEYMPQTLVTTPDGQWAYLLFAGQEAKKKEPAKPSVLLRIETATATVAARHEFKTAPTSLLLAASGERVLVAWPGKSDNVAANRRPGKVELLDATSLASVATLDLPGPAGGLFWNEDRSRVYALDQGIDVKAAAKSLPAHLFVVDPLAGKLLADLEVGIGPSPLSWDNERKLFYLLTRPRKTPGAGAALQIIEDDQVTHEIELPRPPLGLVVAPDRSHLYVLEEKGITILDGELGGILGTIPMARTPTALLFLDPPTRAYVHHAGTSVVTPVDLENRRPLGEIVTGRTSVKVGQFFAAVGVGVLGAANSQILYGNPYAMPAVVTLPDPQTVGFVGPDGTTVFLHNSQTNDLTIVETTANRVITMIGGGNARLLPDGKTVLAQQAATLQMYDTAAKRLLPPLELGINGFTLCPDGRHVYNGVGFNKGMQRVDLQTRRIDPMHEEVAGTIVFAYPRPLPAPPIAATPEPSTESAEPSVPLPAGEPSPLPPEEPVAPPAAATVPPPANGEQPEPPPAP